MGKGGGCRVEEGGHNDGQESGSAAERGVGDMNAGERNRVDPTEEGMKVPVAERPRKPTTLP